MRSSVGIAVVHPSLLPVDCPEGGLQGRIVLGDRRRRVWLKGDPAVGRAGEDPGEIWLSSRVRDALDASDGDVVDLHVADAESVEVLPAKIDDLPEDDIVQLAVSASEVATYAATKGDGWLLAIVNGIPHPLRVQDRPVPAGKVRLSLQTRTLLGVSTADGPARIVLSSFVPTAATGELPRRPPAPERRLVASAPRRLRLAGLNLLEFASERAFVAPPVALASEPAQIGDDSRSVVRLDEELFPLLAISPGAQLFVSWGRRVAVGIALPWKPQSDRDEAARSGQLVDQRWQRPMDSVPRALRIGVSADIRDDLGMPRYSLVRVRRRLWPLLLRRTNELVIPVGGLVFAMLTVKDTSLRKLAVAFLGLLALSLAPLRYSRRPRGRIR